MKLLTSFTRYSTNNSEDLAPYTYEETDKEIQKEENELSE